MLAFYALTWVWIPFFIVPTSTVTVVSNIFFSFITLLFTKRTLASHSRRKRTPAGHRQSLSYCESKRAPYVEKGRYHGGTMPRCDASDRQFRNEYSFCSEVPLFFLEKTVFCGKRTRISILLVTFSEKHTQFTTWENVFKIELNYCF